ncbi:MAG: hypothetical protein KAS32_23940 [Candidatus Peribacteraceae bacterium]|nr:hypothetical protein [Candidatus Peribacteraceae bacterium]
MISIKDLVPGKAYEVDGRNFSVTIWTGKDFAGLRYKFGDRFIDHENHWDNSLLDGTCKPIKLLE